MMISKDIREFCPIDASGEELEREVKAMPRARERSDRVEGLRSRSRRCERVVGRSVAVCRRNQERFLDHTRNIIGADPLARLANRAIFGWFFK
jgi:phosphate uptake regulator